jgi:hypothetical protein
MVKSNGEHVVCQTCPPQLTKSTLHPEPFRGLGGRGTQYARSRESACEQWEVEGRDYGPRCAPPECYPRNRGIAVPDNVGRWVTEWPPRKRDGLHSGRPVWSAWIPEWSGSSPWKLGVSTRLEARTWLPNTESKRGAGWGTAGHRVFTCEPRSARRCRRRHLRWVCIGLRFRAERAALGRHSHFRSHDAGVSSGHLHWRARAYALYVLSGICSTSRVGVLVLLGVLTSCAAASTVATRAPAASINPASLAQSSCARSHFVISSSGPEIQGITTGSNQFWALLFERPPLPAGTSNKIVFRLTATGPLALAAYGPGGVRIAPDWVEQHGSGSTWSTHPGGEWGAGFTFPHAGCWEVVAIRGGLVGRVGFPVA